MTITSKGTYKTRDGRTAIVTNLGCFAYGRIVGEAPGLVRFWELADGRNAEGGSCGYHISDLVALHEDKAQWALADFWRFYGSSSSFRGEPRQSRYERSRIARLFYAGCREHSFFC